MYRVCRCVGWVRKPCGSLWFGEEAGVAIGINCGVSERVDGRNTPIGRGTFVGVRLRPNMLCRRSRKDFDKRRR
jgi:hypothetical protein